MAPGSTTNRQRTRSSWKLNQGLVEIAGLMGQYGNDAISRYAAQAIAAQSSIWHQPRATRGRGDVRAIDAPTLLPMPRPSRNTPRISENA